MPATSSTVSLLLAERLVRRRRGSSRLLAGDADEHVASSAARRLPVGSRHDDACRCSRTGRSAGSGRRPAGDVLRDDALAMFAPVFAWLADRCASPRRRRRRRWWRPASFGAFGSLRLVGDEAAAGRGVSPPTIPVGSTREAARFSACATRARCSSIAWPSVTIRSRNGESSGTDGPPVTAGTWPCSTVTSRVGSGGGPCGCSPARRSCSDVALAVAECAAEIVRPSLPSSSRRRRLRVRAVQGVARRDGVDEGLAAGAGTCPRGRRLRAPSIVRTRMTPRRVSPFSYDAAAGFSPRRTMSTSSSRRV
jgi:hypothetical protein